MSQDLAKKLGLLPGQRVGLLNAPEECAALIQANSPPGVILTELPGEKRCDLIFFWPERLEGLVQRFCELQQRIDPDGAIWVVIPKKKYVRQRGIDFSWEQMQAAALQTDLVDNKVATLSEQEYATRFVIRKELRQKYAQLGMP